MAVLYTLTWGLAEMGHVDAAELRDDIQVALAGFIQTVLIDQAYAWMRNPFYYVKYIIKHQVTEVKTPQHFLNFFVATAWPGLYLFCAQFDLPNIFLVSILAFLFY